MLIVRLSATDALAQVDLFEGSLDGCRLNLDKCGEMLKRHAVPARSWYDYAHQLTWCAYRERREEWDEILNIAEETDAELERRQYKALRTSMLCAKARALARTGRHAQADHALNTAMRACPRGAVDPLIVLEASKALCASLRGDTTKGATYYERALAACRAIGHRYHETWITRDRDDVVRSTRSTITTPPRTLEITDAALLLTDVATVLGAGHSIELLAHHTASILQSTGVGSRVEVDSESGCEFDAEPSASWEIEADSTFCIRLRGSDRRVAVRVRDAEGIDSVSLLKSVADIVQSAINRTADTENEDENQNLWPRVAIQAGEDTVFRSPRMTELLRVAARLASTEVPILITGETGTGKEIIAKLIHEHSRLKRGPFVAFNCSAVPRDLVESQLFGHRRGAFTGATDAFPGVIRAAERGTLFLDEVGDLDQAVQPKLLRFLESGEIHALGDSRPQHVGVRVVAATNADLDGLVDRGQFRRDLFYRIGVARISLPPLRERKDEIPAMASLFVARYARECGRTSLRLADDFMAALLLYDWPGNIRELANEIRRVVAMADDGDTLTAAVLSPAIAKHWRDRPSAESAAPGPTIRIRLDQTLADAISELEQHFIEHALGSSGGRVAEAAEMLGLSRKGLFLKRRRRGLVPGSADNSTAI